MDHAGIATAMLRSACVVKAFQRPGRENSSRKSGNGKTNMPLPSRNNGVRWGSVDYSRERFTLDEGLPKLFARPPYKKSKPCSLSSINLLHCTLSDIEVIHYDVEGASTMNHMLEDGSRALEVATTRPETMFGDGGCGQSRRRPRYKDLIGKMSSFQSLINWFQSLETNTRILSFWYLVSWKSHLPTIQTTSYWSTPQLCHVNVMNDIGTMNTWPSNLQAGPFWSRKAVVAVGRNWRPLKSKTCPQRWSLRNRCCGWTTLVYQWFVKWTTNKNAIANPRYRRQGNFYPPRFNDIFPPMDGKCPWLGNLTSALVGSPNPAWYNACTKRWQLKPGRVTVDSDEDVLTKVVQSSALGQFHHGRGCGCRLRRHFKRYYPTSTFGDWLWYYSILGVLHDFPRFGIWRKSPIQMPWFMV